MSKELKVRPSPMLVLCYVAIAICILGFLACSVLGLVDFRSEEQKEIDYRNELVESGLFKEAKRVISYINKYPSQGPKKTEIMSISCWGISKIGSTRAVVRITTYDNICYYYRVTKEFEVAFASENLYTDFVIDGRFSNLTLKDKELEILFEEVEK